MKKSLSLIAILGLLLIVSNAFAVAPIFNDIPDLKFYVNQGLSAAFDLSQYNTGDVATSYSIAVNGNGLTSLAGSVVGQNNYGSVTVTNNSYLAANSGGSSLTTSNKAKYADYKIYKLPKVGLNVGSSYTVLVSTFTNNSSGLTIPPSFGSASAIIVSDTTKVTAIWSANSTSVIITSIAQASGPVFVDVIASANAAAPFGLNQDKERVEVTNNLVTGISFSASADTANFGLEIAPGKTTLPPVGFAATVNDGAGVASDGGVMTFAAADNVSGVKATLNPAKWINVTAGNWYKTRAKVFVNTTIAGEQFILFGFNGTPGAGHTDVGANASFGIPTTWTWLEAPFQAANSTTASGYIQFQFKASGAETLNIDELQIVQSAPTLVDASRLATRAFYAGGDFDVAADTTGWGQEVYAGAGSSAGISVSNGDLVLDFTGAASGANQKGIKWTANNFIGGGVIYTPAATIGREVVVRVDFGIQSGAFNTLGILLAAAYGVQTSGQVTIAQPPSNLIAAAQIGSLIAGTTRTVAKATNNFYQFQFGFRSDATGILNVHTVDYDRDQDDTNYGNGSLFP